MLLRNGTASQTFKLLHPKHTHKLQYQANCRRTMYVFALCSIFALIFQPIASHSLLSFPRPTAAKACRLGGVPVKGGIALCPGPCDVRSLQPGFPHITSPTRPAAVFKRGESVTIKYQRNNHGPGGFVRYSLVPVSQMMDKRAHERNAFHYGCWGANSVAAKHDELGRDEFGFSLVGGDGKLHDFPVSYYTTNVTIPQVVPDGNYVLGWVWYGGMGGSIVKNVPENPYPIGLFADYWSCSFAKIEGGAPLKTSYRPVFQNDMKKYWSDGCMSANDQPGICTYEPCRVPGEIQLPKEFKYGREPDELSLANFVPDPKSRSSTIKEAAIPTPVPMSSILEEVLAKLYQVKEEYRLKNTKGA